jgi:hypothetical protein
VSHAQLQLFVIAGWFLTVGAALAVRLTMGAAGWSLAEAVGWVLAGTLPTFVLRAVFVRPAVSIGQVLYDAEQTTNAARQSIAAQGKDVDVARR